MSLLKLCESSSSRNLREVDMQSVVKGLMCTHLAIQEEKSEQIESTRTTLQDCLYLCKDAQIL